MTSDQFAIAARLASIESESLLAFAHAVLVDGISVEHAAQTHGLRLGDAQKAIASIECAAIAIRSAFVIHPPAEFRILVGHNDFHRMPGTLRLEVGQIVRLVACAAERWIPVRVERLPERPAGYFEGVITDRITLGGRFAPGDRVRFSEDQVETPVAKKRSSRIPSRVRPELSFKEPAE